MNRGELRTLASNLCEDPKQTKFTPAQYNDGLDKAQKQFALDSKALYKDSAITMVVDTAVYLLPTDFMLEKAVTLNGIELDPISRATLQANKDSGRWDDDKGTPRYFVIDPEEAKKTITLYPIPDSDADGTSIVLTYYPVPATMSADTSIPLNSSTLMVQFHIGLAHYAAWLMLSYLTQSPEISQKRGELFSVYTTKVTDAIQTFGNTKSEPMRFHVEDMRIR
jgi:hypothetical protein